MHWHPCHWILDILHQNRSAVSDVWLTLYFQIGQSICIGIHRQIRQITLFILKAVQILVWSNLRITVDILWVPTFAWCQGMVMVRFCSTFHELQPSAGAASLGSRGNYQGMQQLGYHVPIENSGVKSSASGPGASRGPGVAQARNKSCAASEAAWESLEGPNAVRTTTICMCGMWFKLYVHVHMCIANLFEIDAMSYQIIACHVNYQIMLYMLHCVLSWCIVSSYVKSYDTLPYILLPH